MVSCQSGVRGSRKRFHFGTHTTGNPHRHYITGEQSMKLAAQCDQIQWQPLFLHFRTIQGRKRSFLRLFHLDVNNYHIQDSHQQGSSTQSTPKSFTAEEDAGRKKKTTKRRKVNHACLYCRRSHMTCDEGRPCQRWYVLVTD